jgi:hypothetical protein
LSVGVAPTAYSSGVTMATKAQVKRNSLAAELWAFMRVRKKFWLLPIILVMFLVGTLLVFAQGSALAPFIYTIF